MSAAAAARPGERIALWFMDEARVGQKGRLCHRWWPRGQRPPGRRDKRFESAYLFAAVEPTTGAEVALVLPEATTVTMNLFLAEFGRRLPEGVHAALVLDGAGWHGAKELEVPANVTLVPLPPYSPELNPAERLFEEVRRRVEGTVYATLDAKAAAVQAVLEELDADPARVRRLCGWDWITAAIATLPQPLKNAA